MHAVFPGTPLRALIATTSLTLAFSGPLAFAQTAPTPSPTASAAAPTTPSTAPIELSPFEVVADNDVGYQAGNTVSGSRLNSRLKDTPASVSAFTPEFLSDIAATNLEEMLQHATNVEVDREDSNAGFNNPAGRGADGNDYQFRMRGSPAGSSRDFVESSIPIDLYNIERAEVASGPNSILFGLGQAGGLVSLSGKKANLNRQRTTVKSMVGSWHFERYEADHNQVLIPKQLSLRLMGVYNNNQGWRHWNFNDTARWTTAVAYQPLKNTVIHASFEKGRVDNNVDLAWNAQDQVTGYQDFGSPIIDGTVAVPGTARYTANNNRFVFTPQDSRVYNYRNEFQSINRYLGPAGTPVESLLPPSISPYGFNVTGPGGVRHQTFHAHHLIVQQKLPKRVDLELAYFSNLNDVEAMAMPPAGSDLRADPNLTLPAPDGSAATIPNPHAGQLYFDANWFKDWIRTENDVYRLTVAWDVGKSDRWYGRHRLAALLEDSSQDRRRRWRNETLVDEANIPITNAANAEGGQNQVFRRNYITPGDFTTYYPSDPSVPLTGYVFNGKTYHSAYASRAQANTHTIKDTKTLMLATQSFWLKDRLVTTLGLRRDDIKFKNEGEARVTASDPRVVAGELVASEWFFNGQYVEHHYKPTTFSAGAVLHATKRLSLFYNLAKNNGAPRFDRTVLPDGEVGPPTEGDGKDYGFMFDVLGDDRLFIRTTWFQTKQLKDTPILPGANALGVDNLASMLDALLDAGKISQADYDRQAVDWTTATIDVFTEGIEVEVVANPTKSLSLRASYSHSKRRRENFFNEIFEFFGTRVPQWRQQLVNDPAPLAQFDQAVVDLDSELAFQVDRQNSPFGSVPHKMNGTARYTFREGKLRGGFLGASVRYTGKNFMSWDRVTGHIYWGNESLLGDAFAGYRFKVPRTRLNATVQLNVKNLTNSYRAIVGRYNDTYTAVRRVNLNEPRSWRLTTTLEF
ncbi:MAG: TonB-dependent receptor plug domain-containing protein [Verrucomicrobiota bacterium]